MRRTGPVGTSSTVRRATAGGLGALLALSGAALTTPASAAPPERTAVIVQLTPGSDAAAESHRAAADGGSVSFVYQNALHGFAGEFTAQAIAAMQRNPHVRLVEPDGVATVSDIQTGPVWGLDRIDEHALPMDGLYDYASNGGGVTAYVIDTGIAPHPEFGTRLKAGTSTVRGQKTTADCNGHGTHVAGTIAGTTYGVAKQATLVPVRVLDCRGSGAWSGIVAGIDWAISHHQQGTPAVANMSLGGGVSLSVDDAVTRLIADGVTVAVAAGNDDADAANFSPARVQEALTVAATDSVDARASFSNFGAGVDLFAPGVGVTSAWLSGGINTISGTSMATPHVTGAAALVLSRSAATRAYSPAQVAAELTGAATANAVTDRAGSPDRLLFVGPATTTQ
jgi:subtilisin family serine protease